MGFTWVGQITSTGFVAIRKNAKAASSIDTGRMGSKRFHKPSVQRAGAQRPAKTDKAERKRQNEEGACRQEENKRNHAGDNGGQKNWLAPHAVGQSSERQLQCHGREGIDSKQQRNLEKVHAAVGQCKRNNGHG